MNTSFLVSALSLVLVTLVVPYAALAQHDFEYTKTVDPSGEADFTSIQDAIDACETPQPDQRYTVLIYAGVYDEALTLYNADPRIDLVGVDRDAVIIKPPADTDAITIEGFGARNNTIRNLTIITDDDGEDQGRGIVIKHPDQGSGDDPSAIKIIGVTIQCEADDSHGLDVEDSATDLEIRNTRITTADGHGIKITKGDGAGAPANITIEGVTIEAAGSGMNGIDGAGVDTLRVFNCRITSVAANAIELKVADSTKPKDVILESVTAQGGVFGLHGIAEQVKILASRFLGDNAGVGFDSARDFEVVGTEIRGRTHGFEGFDIERGVCRNCLIVADNPNGGSAGATAVRVDASYGLEDPLTLIGCRIEALNTSTGDTEGVLIDVGKIVLLDCDIRAISTYQEENPGLNDEVAPAYGFTSTALGPAFVAGGSICTAVEPGDSPPNNNWEKQTEIWDMEINSGHNLFLSGGTVFSKWKGLINPNGRPSSVVQRTINVAAPSSTWILDSHDLTNDEQPNVTPDHQPDVFRVLSVTGNQPGMNQDVYLIGTDFAGRRIVEKITLADNLPVKGNKPFKTITKIILPAQTAHNQTVAVGTTWKLGLQFPISAATDVTQEARLVSNIYTTQDVGTVDAVYSTVIPSTRNDGDSFEWAVLASQ